MIQFDHKKLVRRDPKEVARFQRWVLIEGQGKLKEMAVLHEHNNSCCRKEPWRVTLASLVRGLKPSQPHVMINLPMEEMKPAGPERN
jgi:hypothetical protein